MTNKKYIIQYLPTFIDQFKEILSYIKNILKNEKAANNLYNEVVNSIEKRSYAPESFEVYKVYQKNKIINYYKLFVKHYIIFYVVMGNVMEIRRIYYKGRDIDNIL